MPFTGPSRLPPTSGGRPLDTPESTLWPSVQRDKMASSEPHSEPWHLRRMGAGRPEGDGGGAAQCWYATGGGRGLRGGDDFVGKFRLSRWRNFPLARGVGSVVQGFPRVAKVLERPPSPPAQRNNPHTTPTPLKFVPCQSRLSLVPLPSDPPPAPIPTPIRRGFNSTGWSGAAVGSPTTGVG